MILDSVLDCCHGIQQPGGRVAEAHATSHEPWCRYAAHPTEPRWPTMEEFRAIARKVVARMPKETDPCA